MLQPPENQEEALKAPLLSPGEGSPAEESWLCCFLVIAPLGGGDPAAAMAVPPLVWHPLRTQWAFLAVPLMEGALRWHRPFGVTHTHTNTHTLWGGGNCSAPPPPSHGVWPFRKTSQAHTQVRLALIGSRKCSPHAWSHYGLPFAPP